MNVLCFTGRLGKDCETRHTAIGDSVTSFSAVFDSGYGEKKTPNWVTCNIWGKRGEAVAPYLLKGTQIAVSGELTNREYTAKDGNKRYSLDVRVNDLTLLGGKSENTHAQNKPASEQKPQPGHDAPAALDDDDISF